MSVPLRGGRACSSRLSRRRFFCFSLSLFIFLFPVSLPRATRNSPRVSGRGAGGPARSVVETVVPFPSVIVPPASTFVPFPPLRTSSPRFRARPPPFDYRLPNRIAPLRFWILFLRLFPSNSSPALLDSVRAFSRMANGPPPRRVGCSSAVDEADFQTTLNIKGSITRDSNFH